jgi:hypothetical protein
MTQATSLYHKKYRITAERASLRAALSASLPRSPDWSPTRGDAIIRSGALRVVCSTQYRSRGFLKVTAVIDLLDTDRPV